MDIIVQLKNISDKPLMMINDFRYKVHHSDSVLEINFYINANRETLKKKPIILKSGKIYSIFLKYKDPGVLSAKVKYHVNNYYPLITMTSQYYMKHIVGKHFDLNKCWNGEINSIPIFLFRPSQDWQRKIRLMDLINFKIEVIIKSSSISFIYLKK